MEQTILAFIVGFVIGVIFHAAVIAWFDRIKALAEAKIKDKLNLPSD